MSDIDFNRVLSMNFKDILLEHLDSVLNSIKYFLDYKFRDIHTETSHTVDEYVTFNHSQQILKYLDESLRAQIEKKLSIIEEQLQNNAAYFIPPAIGYAEFRLPHINDNLNIKTGDILYDEVEWVQIWITELFFALTIILKHSEKADLNELSDRIRNLYQQLEKLFIKLWERCQDEGFREHMIPSHLSDYRYSCELGLWWNCPDQVDFTKPRPRFDKYGKLVPGTDEALKK